jgi:SAM-dependent methyltransferase
VPPYTLQQSRDNIAGPWWHDRSVEAVDPNERHASTDVTSGYFRTRFTFDPARAEVWRHICRFLERWIPRDAEVLELGAGWCDFSNNVRARRVVAMDADRIVTTAARDGVDAVVGDCTDLSRFADETFDAVVASNLLEHVDRAAALRLLSESKRVLRARGRLILIQPNFRLAPGRYFDDYTHVSIYTDRSLYDLLHAEGWHVQYVAPRFLPLSMRSRASRFTFIVPFYLRAPVKPFAGQMLIVASR